MISGSKTNLAVKIFGPDLAVLRGLAADAERRLRDVPGIVDLSNQEQQSVPQLLVDFDRAAMARYGLSPGRRSPAASRPLFQGTEAGEIVEGGLASRVVVRFPERLRKDRERLDELPVTRARGRGSCGSARWPACASISGPASCAARTCSGSPCSPRTSRGPTSWARSRGRGSPLAGLALPPGYQVTFGGQFEEAARSQQNLGPALRPRPRRHVRPAAPRLPRPPPRRDRPRQPPPRPHRRRRRAWRCTAAS